MDEDDQESNGPKICNCVLYLGVCGIDFQSSVRFEMECQKILRNQFSAELNKVSGTVQNQSSAVENVLTYLKQ